MYVYLLASGKHGTLYVGVTNNLVRRVYEHKTKAVPSFTSQYGVDRLVWYESYDDPENAILREKDILTPETADTPAKLVYLAVQLMYISPDPQVNHGTYFNLVRDIVTAAPSAWPIIEEINNHILNGGLYQALKEARRLVAYEKQLLDHNEAVRAEAQRHSA